MDNQNYLIQIKTSVDQTGINKGLKDVEKKINQAESSKDLDLKIKTSLDTLAAAKSLTDYRKSLKELKGLSLEIGDSSSADFKRINEAIGETNDKIGDMNSLIKSQSGEPIENLKNSFKGVGDSLKSLDFKSAKAQFSVLTDSTKKLTSEFLGGFNVLKNYKKAMTDGSTASQGLSTAMKGLGKSIAATGIGLLVIAVAALIANFDKLKGAGGIVGKMFQAIGDIVKYVTDKLIELSDWLGLTNIKETKMSNDRLKNLEKEKTKIEDRYDVEIAKADAAGKSTVELEKQKNKAIMANASAQIAAIENIRKATGTLSEEQIAQLESLKDEINKLNTANQIIDIKETKRKNDEAKKASEKAAEDNKKKKEAYKKHLDDIKSIRDKYYTDERAKVAQGYDEDLAKLNQKIPEEKKLYDELLQSKLAALVIYDQKVKDEEEQKNQAITDQLNKNAKEQAKIIKDYNLNNDIVDKMFADERLNNWKATDDEIYANIREKLQARVDEVIRTNNAEIGANQVKIDAINNQLKNEDELKLQDKLDYYEQLDELEGENRRIRMEAELADTELTEQERNNIIARYTNEKEQSERDSIDRIKQAREQQTQKDIELAQNYANAVTSLGNTIADMIGSNAKKGSEAEKKAAKTRFAITKASGLVNTGIHTAEAVMAMMKAGPIAGQILAGVTAAFGIAQMAAIAAKKFDPGSPDTSTPSTPTPPTPSMPAPSADKSFNLGSITKLQKPGDMQQRVYVTETDISRVQNKVSVTESRATLK